MICELVRRFELFASCAAGHARALADDEVGTNHLAHRLASAVDAFDQSIGRRRAEQVADLLRGAGLTELQYDVKWQDETKRAKGVENATLRRVQIVVSR